MTTTTLELPAFLDRRPNRNGPVPGGDASARSAVVHEIPTSASPEIPKAASLEFHGLANCFPLMEGPEYELLVSDVREHGQREPIVIHENQILDGRNRFRACIDAGIKPKTVEWDGRGTPAAFVVSCNIHRRHLGPSQLGMAAARIANLKLGHVGHQIAQAEGGGQIFPPISNQRAADMLGVSRHTVTDSKKVLTHGTPAEIAAVDRGVAAASTTASKIRSKTRASVDGQKPSPAGCEAENSYAGAEPFLKKLLALAVGVPAISDVENALRTRPKLLASLVNKLPALRQVMQTLEAVAAANADALLSNQHAENVLRTPLDIAEALGDA